MTMKTDNSPLAINAVADEIKARHGSDTRAMVREMAATLFFRYNEQPTASRVYSLLRKGSMTTVQDALQGFWEDLRSKSKLQLNAPGVPQSVLDYMGQAISTAWNLAIGEAKETVALIRTEAEREIERIRSDSAKAIDSAQRLTERYQQDATQAHVLASQEREERKNAESKLSDTIALLQSAEITISNLKEQMEKSAQAAEAERKACDIARKELLGQIEAMTAERQREREMLEGLRKKTLTEIDQARADLKIAREEAKIARGEAERERTKASTRTEALSKEVAELRTELAQARQFSELQITNTSAVKNELERARTELRTVQDKIEALLVENGRLRAENDAFLTRLLPGTN